MNTIIEIDRAGRIVVPKKFRDALHLKPGTRLRIEHTGEQLVLEPEYSEPKLEMRDGLLVMVGGERVTLEETNAVIRQGYEVRHKRIMEGSGLE
jgi:AbrB family looped-hinge helix DNA binding protein